MQFLPSTALLALTAAAALPSALAASCTGYLTTPSNIAACADQLTARGSELCKVTSGFTTTFCEIGDAMIVGVGVGSPSGVETSSPCIDIAIAVGHILDQCTHEVVPYGMKSSGEEKANRNGDIVVHAVLKQ